MEEVMNKYGENGWDIAFQLIEKHRMLLFWSIEAIIITFSRDKKQINYETNNYINIGCKIQFVQSS